MNPLSGVSVALLNVTKCARRGCRVSKNGGLVVGRSVLGCPRHFGSLKDTKGPTFAGAVAVCEREPYSCAGKYKLQCEVNPHWLLTSPALRVSYTTVYVPQYRFFHTSRHEWCKESSKSSSQVEVTKKALKDKAKAAGSPLSSEKRAALAVRKSLGQRIKDELLHYYHGFKLLFIDARISCKYIWRVLNGDTLSRREHRQLVRTTSDLFRLLPFSVFVIIPFMEFLLPVALKLFPGMLPSTFETANEKEAKMKKTLKIKLEMAKFLQQTLDNMAVQAKGRRSESAKEFVQFYEKIHKTGEQVSNEEILKFSKLFEDEITLDSMTRPQLVALCRLLEMQAFGTNNFLRFQLRMKLRSLVADDKIIQREGVESLAVWELQQACRTRGMRAYGMSEERLQNQLKQWLALSLDERVPPSLLLLSRTLYLPPNIQAADTLAKTISELPEEVATRTKAAIGKREGKIDNFTLLEIIKVEEAKIAEEKKEKDRLLAEKQQKEEAARLKSEQETRLKEESMRRAVVEAQAEMLSSVVPEPPPTIGKILTEEVKELQDKTPSIEDKAPVIETAEVLTEEKPKIIVEAASKTAPGVLSRKDLQEVEEALETLGVETKRLLIEEQELQDLKSDMAEYEEDIQVFKKVIEGTKQEKELRESKAARRLFSRVNKMINRLDGIMTSLKEEKAKKQKIVDAGEDKGKEKEELVSIDDLVKSLSYICHTPDISKVEMIRAVLDKMDDDQDGAVKIEHVLKVLELITEEQVVGVSQHLVEDVIDMVSKEEKLETATLIQRALKSSLDHAQAASKEEEAVKATAESKIRDAEVLVDTAPILGDKLCDSSKVMEKNKSLHDTKEDKKKASQTQ
ncbi:mitochondrial proton/calcium exchanger protein-like isoform X2 [Oratosquilla oratoria]|uniref:mitochondrial proton/calcium exchanger protein-like isoform X2 n=1 Tax=Oratosquilla oratoria TaxID=337810 RepID=UPI003F75C3FB